MRVGAARRRHRLLLLLPAIEMRSPAPVYLTVGKSALLLRSRHQAKM